MFVAVVCGRRCVFDCFSCLCLWVCLDLLCLLVISAVGVTFCVCPSVCLQMFIFLSGG